MEFTYAGNATNNLVTKNKQLNMYKDIVKGSLIIERIILFNFNNIFTDKNTEIKIDCRFESHKGNYMNSDDYSIVIIPLFDI